METIEIQIRKRAGHGSGEAGRLRRSGIIPGVLYGGSFDEAVSVEVDHLVYEHKISRTGSSQIFVLQSDDSDLSGQMALVRDMQIEPIKGKALHIDFLALKTGEKIRVEVPIKITGQSPAVKLGEAVLSQMINDVEVECLPREIPSEILLDVSNLGTGDSLTIGDLVLPPEVELKSDTHIAVVTALSKKRMAADADAADAAGAEGAEAGAEGAAAEGGAAGDAGE
ncbi:MAG: 50S ribosomal protein L25 [Bdellovibrionales bacterium]|nr:50S ribosomal protein L25 [Bdellovibrionales bacterium]